MERDGKRQSVIRIEVCCHREDRLGNKLLVVKQGLKSFDRDRRRLNLQRLIFPASATIEGVLSEICVVNGSALQTQK